VNPWLILVCGALLLLAFLGHLAAKESAKVDRAEPDEEYMTGFASACGSVSMWYDADFGVWEVTELDRRDYVVRVSGFTEFAAAEEHYLSVRDLLLEDSARDEVQV
jgi:hypothetical protein